MSRSWNKRIGAAAALLVLLTAAAEAKGPLKIGDDPAVTIYRDFDDGLFGRSVYRGVVFSVKLGSFGRYGSLEVGDLDGLTAYLVSSGRAEEMALNRAFGTSRFEPASAKLKNLPDENPEKWIYEYESGGIRISFLLERAPEELYDEIVRTYPENPSVADEVSQSYRGGYVVRILTAENVYRPYYARIDYEDILISAALIGDDFQPLWGIHDGNALTTAGF